jgi:peptidoglycan/xylan/chitin deacetylase (PgdA/CDA1 family)
VISRGARRVRAWWGRSFRSQAVVLLYHRVADLDIDPWSLAVTPEHFAQHLEVLRRYTTPVPLRDLVRQLRTGRIRRGSVAITFDDGYHDNLQTAKPLLERYETPATVFVATGYMGGEREFWWDELEALLLEPDHIPTEVRLSIRGEERCWRLTAYPAGSIPNQDFRLRAYRSIWETMRSLHREECECALSQLRVGFNKQPSSRPTHRLMTTEEVAELGASELVEIGAHTESHPSLATLTLDEQRREIQGSVERLEEVTEGHVTSFAYPFGRPTDYTQATAGLVRDLGLECACSNFAGAVHAATDPYQIPRIYVNDVDGDRFVQMLAEWLPLIPNRTPLA